MHILLVESDPIRRSLIIKYLENITPPAECVEADALESALHLLGTKRFEVIISNLSLQDAQGEALFSALQKSGRRAPIVLLSLTAEQEGEHFLSLGALDVLGPEDLHEGSFTRLLHYLREREVLEEGLRQLSFTDELTRLYNRRGFFALAEQRRQVALRVGMEFLIFFADLDNLKTINDHYGHHAGDIALGAIAEALSRAFTSEDIVARIGGDEFAAISFAQPDRVEAICREIEREVGRFNEEHKLPVALTLSMGIAHFSLQESESIEALLEKADMALYSMKQLHHSRQK